MINSKREYNEFIRANLPFGIEYDSARYQYVTFNGKRFPTYLQAKWYVDYLTKFGGGPEDDLRNDLFAGGEEGVWYDPSDLTTLFQDTAGTTPVTTPGQTVALMLDKSGNDYHATQSTAAARPKYGIVPETGRRNLLGYTEDFSNAVWLKLSGGTGSAPTVTDEYADGPNNAPATRIQFNRGAGTTSSDRSRVFQEVVDPASGVGVNTIWMRSTDGVSTYSIRFTNGSAVETKDVTGSWTKFTVASSSTALNFQVELRGDVGSDITADILVSEPQAEFGSTATAYQRVTTDLDVTEAGVPSLGYLSFDGVDDVLISPSAIFFGEASSMILGVESFSGSGVRTVGTDSANIGILVRETIATIGFVNNFTIGSGAISTGVSFSNKRVCSWLRSQSQNSALLRFDGAGVASTTHDQADNNSRPLAVGGRTTGDFGAMNFFSLVHIARFINEAELSRTETYIAKKTGVTL